MQALGDSGSPCLSVGACVAVLARRSAKGPPLPCLGRITEIFVPGLRTLSQRKQRGKRGKASAPKVQVSTSMRRVLQAGLDTSGLIFCMGYFDPEDGNDQAGLAAGPYRWTGNAHDVANNPTSEAVLAHAVALVSRAQMTPPLVLANKEAARIASTLQESPDVRTTTGKRKKREGATSSRGGGSSREEVSDYGPPKKKRCKTCHVGGVL